ncbi:MAG: hypothetical protein DRJ45_05700 [Thermoprotei archaeon]|nr:MAG: hypothetical protein DRJ45_05700 [Thermoprotei archaeon]
MVRSKKKVVLYRTDLEAFTERQGPTFFTIYYWVSSDAGRNLKSAIENAISVWCKRKGYEKEKNAIFGHVAYGDKRAARDEEMEVRKLIQQIIRATGYKPQLKR